MSKKTTICLCCIVRDESKVIRRLIDSCRDLIDYWVIVDTGSKDDTMGIIRKELRNIPGELHQEPWVNFGHNRTQLMKYARSKADYLLLADADFEIVIRDDFNKEDLKENAYHIRYLGDIDFAQILLVKGSLEWKYIGVTHEYIYTDNIGKTPIYDKLQILHHGDGGHRAEKLDRDIALLTQAIEDNPKEPRNYFYLAQTYSNKGEGQKAIEYYTQRAKMGGWPEEVYYSLFQIGVLLYSLNNMPSAIQQLMEAYSYRPTRFEALYTLGVIFREQKKYHLAQMFQEKVISMNYPKEDMLFVHKNNWEYLANFELAICNFWTEDYNNALKHALYVKGIPGVNKQVTDQNEKNIQYIRTKLDKKEKGINDIVYCSMFTVDTPYEQEIKKLQKGLDKYGLKYELVGLQSRNDWTKNTQMKAGVIKAVMEKYNKDVVWIDADAELLQEPVFFEDIKSDISFYYIKEWDEMLTGTLYFRNNDKVKDFLNRWDGLNKQSSKPDAVNFQQVMKADKSLLITPLPAEYIKIFDNPLIKADNPVIVHNQASRRFKNQVSVPANGPVNRIMDSLMQLKGNKDTCAVIGNGPFQSNFDKIIDDSFVFRCNNFKTGYKGIGNRTDINVSSLYHEIIPDKKVDHPILHVLPISDKLYQQYTDAKMMHIHWERNGKYLISMGNTVWMYGDQEMYAGIFEEVAREINAFPTVGIMAIATARKMGFKQIILSGFTFFESDKSHYWTEKKIRPSSHHNTQAEKKLLQKWIEQDNIDYVLDDMIKHKITFNAIIESDKT